MKRAALFVLLFLVIATPAIAEDANREEELLTRLEVYQATYDEFESSRDKIAKLIAWVTKSRRELGEKLRAHTQLCENFRKQILSHQKDVRVHNSRCDKTSKKLRSANRCNAEAGLLVKKTDEQQKEGASLEYARKQLETEHANRVQVIEELLDADKALEDSQDVIGELIQSTEERLEEIVPEDTVDPLPSPALLKRSAGFLFYVQPH